MDVQETVLLHFGHISRLKNENLLWVFLFYLILFYSSFLVWLLLLLALTGWILAVTFICFWISDEDTNDLPRPFRSNAWTGKYTHGAVAADDGLCSEIGRLAHYRLVHGWSSSIMLASHTHMPDPTTDVSNIAMGLTITVFT